MEKEKEKTKKKINPAWLLSKLKDQLMGIIYFAIPVAFGVVLVRILWEWIKFVWTYPLF